MNCPKCGCSKVAVHAQTHHRCPECHQFSFPTSLSQSEDAIRPLDRVTPFKCPCCPNSDLHVGRLRDLAEVCYCPNCRGFVIDSPTFGHLLAKLRSLYTGPDDSPVPLCPTELLQHKNCPACLDRMEVHPYHGAGNSVIDTCGHCKLIWFDCGEFSRLVQAPGRRDQPAGIV